MVAADAARPFSRASEIAAGRPFFCALRRRQRSDHAPRRLATASISKSAVAGVGIAGTTTFFAVAKAGSLPSSLAPCVVVATPRQPVRLS